MTFRLADQAAVYPTGVRIDVPGVDGPEAHECTLHFRLLDAEVARKLALESDEAFFLNALAGWEGIAAHDGSPLEFTPENVALLAAIPYFVRGASSAYDRFVMGLPGKTSAPPRSTGSAPGAAATRSKRTPPH